MDFLAKILSIHYAGNAKYMVRFLYEIDMVSRFKIEWHGKEFPLKVGQEVRIYIGPEDKQ